MGKRTFELETAQEAAGHLTQILAQVTGRIEVVGSVRRRRPRVGDLDLLVLPKDKDAKALAQRLIGLGFIEVIHVREVVPGHEAPERFRIIHCATGVPVDIHVCQTMQTWWTRLVFETGPRKFVDELQTAAQEKAKTLGPDGISDHKGRIMHPKSERGVFAAVGHAFTVPTAR